MNDADKRPFYTMMVGMSDFYDKPISEGALKLWWFDLREFELADIERAFHVYRLSDEGRYLPKTSDIAKIINGSGADRSMRAWSMVDKTVRSVGRYQTVVFDDEIIMVVINDMGGWEKFGVQKESELPFVAKEFCNRYKGYVLQGGVTSWPNKLPGLIERNNSAMGGKVPEPLLIGNPTKAKQVLLAGSSKPMLQVTAANVVGLLTNGSK